MLIFEQLLDPMCKGLVFNREVVAMFPAIRKAKMEEFKWLVGECSAMNRVRATPTTPVTPAFISIRTAFRSRNVHLYYRTGRDATPVFNV